MYTLRTQKYNYRHQPGNKPQGAKMANLSSLINAVAGAASHSDLCDAYMAARVPCREAGRMDELLSANAEAEKRLGAQKIEPMYLGIRLA